MENLSNIHVVILILAILARFLRAIKVSAKELEPELFTIRKYFTVGKSTLWLLHVIFATLGIIALPGAFRFCTYFFPAYLPYLNQLDLLITFLIGFAAYDGFKLISKPTRLLFKHIVEWVFDKIRAFFGIKPK